MFRQFGTASLLEVTRSGGKTTANSFGMCETHSPEPRRLPIWETQLVLQGCGSREKWIMKLMDGYLV